MQKHEACHGRRHRSIDESFDLVVVGGGLAGVCASITAARQGLRVALVQDRPVLGGNASSEVRLWVLGATSHMGNNNRWAREGGVIDEILVENMFRNPEGNPVLVDSLVLEKVAAEKNITLLLNTAVHDLRLAADGSIESVRGFCSQNGTEYILRAPLFCDASGDGVVGFMAGAAFRMGAESRAEFGELMAPEEASSDLLGHTLYFYARDTGRPVRYVRPAFAIDDITAIPRYRSFTPRDQGCQLWWIEYGGRRDTVHDTEAIKWELWRIVYGVWDHIKNSGRFPESKHLTLEWVGAIPGKRESRRFEGDYILTQQDVVDQRRHYDAVSFGGWAIDLHPADGVYSPESPCTQYHSKGVYQIPLRAMYSRNVPNLFLAGRIVSASHVAFGSTRVMATCAHGGQAVGMAAAVCRENDWLPRELAEPQRVPILQQRLLRTGQYIPGMLRKERSDLAQRALVTASSEATLGELPAGEESVPLTEAIGLLLPVQSGVMPELMLEITAPAGTQLVAELRTASRPGNFTPDVLLDTLVASADVEAGDHGLPEPATGSRREYTNGHGNGYATHTHPAKEAVHAAPHFARRRSAERVAMAVGANAPSAAVVSVDAASGPVADVAPDVRTRCQVRLQFAHEFESQTYALVALQPNPDVDVHLSDARLPGVLTLRQRGHASVAKGASQNPPPGAGIDAFDFWTPERRPRGKNVAVRLSPPIACFAAEQAVNGVGRPTTQTNAWVASLDDPQPAITLAWSAPQRIAKVEVVLDTDADHPMESVLMQHPERIMPHCVRNLRLKTPEGRVLAEVVDNHQTRIAMTLDPPVETTALILEADHPTPLASACIVELKCYGPA